MAKVIHWKFRFHAKALMVNLCNSRAVHRKSDGSIIYKPTRGRVHAGTCQRCEKLGHEAGLL